MKKGAVKLTKGKVAAIVSIAAAAVVVCTLLIINIWFPVKYASAYFTTRNRSAQDGIYFHFLDVGQADCTIIEFPDGKVMLIDGGDGTYTNTLKIIKALNKLDIDNIDYLVCTSVNGEHCGGLADILQVKSASVIYYPYTTNIYITDEYYEFYKAASASGAEMVISEYGVGASGGKGDTEYFFTFLSPSVHGSPSGEYALMNSSPTAENMDNASAVMWLQCGDSGVFYAGDVRSSVLDAIAENYTLYKQNDMGSYYSYGGQEIDFSCCVLCKVANHGNYNSVSPSLYSLLSPVNSVISVGEDNASGSPSIYVMADLYAYGGIYITMYTGDITIKTDSSGAYVV
ncbi:MAG: MBL fold metallo-hydrolase [Clostridia bacterium]|nr:MBL fold metallo-hydrolase [Clostridia bacterium]